MPVRSPIAIGTKFGRLTVLGEDGFHMQAGRVKIYRARCSCDCGNIASVPEQKLRSSHTRSCGCLGLESSISNLPDAVHGHARNERSPTYIAWQAMIARCQYPSHANYEMYGGAGISVCSRWQAFEAFLVDMGERPNGLTLDRINGAKGYFKENCRWADWRTQQQNRKNNRLVSLRGQTVCVAEASRLLKIDGTTIHARAKRLSITLQEACDFYASRP